MEEKDRNNLAGLLIQYSMDELNPLELKATHSRDFDKLKEICNIKSAIGTILESLEHEHQCCENCSYYYTEAGTDLCRYWDAPEEDVENSRCHKWHKKEGA